MNTESPSLYQDIDKMDIISILKAINEEDKKVALEVEKSLIQVEKLVEVIVAKLKIGGRLFYIGAGTSGRLGVVDASECPPTFGVPFDMVIGIIAGGDGAIRKAVEFAEDNQEQAWIDLKAYNINKRDVVVGIAASGKTPYVTGGLKKCNEEGIVTGSICCNGNAPISNIANYPIEVVTGAEFVTGSTRMKAGTAQKMVLNMITTSVMIKLGRVKGNRMVDMMPSNNKLVDRGTKMIMEEINISYEEAEQLLKKHGNVRKAVDNYKMGNN